VTALPLPHNHTIRLRRRTRRISVEHRRTVCECDYQHRGLQSEALDARTFALLRRHVWHAWVTALRRFVSPVPLNQLGGERPPEADEGEIKPGPAALRGAGWRGRNWAGTPMRGLFELAPKSRVLFMVVRSSGRNCLDRLSKCLILRLRCWGNSHYSPLAWAT
jgi:hypothetical protein